MKRKHIDRSIPKALLRIKTPLGLAGGIVAVLYALYRQILSLGIFSQVTASDTAQIIDSIIQKLFILAITAVILSLVLYLISKVLPHQNNKGKIKLVDASLASDKNYEERKRTDKGGSVEESEITPKTE